MASTTDNLNLVKQANSENWSNDIHNANLQKIDDFAGAFGAKLFPLGTAQTISSATNFNNLIDIKNYVITSNTVAAACSNCPSSSAGKLCTWSIDGNGFDRTWVYGGQIYIDISGKEYRRSMITNGSKVLSFGAWTQIAPYIAGTWTPKLYDYETYKRDLTQQAYFKIGNFYVMFIYQSNIDYSGITTMVQYRNLPCTNCIGGTVYLQGRKGSIAKDIGAYIQGSSNRAYVRENIVSTDFSNPTSSGITNVVLFGYD